MRLRLSPEGVRVLDDWRTRCNPTDHDQQLVADVLRTIAERRWYGRWYSYSDLSDLSITIIEPRPGLTVYVRLWSDHAVDDQFELLRILDEPKSPNDD